MSTPKENLQQHFYFSFESETVRIAFLEFL